MTTNIRNAAAAAAAGLLLWAPTEAVAQDYPGFDLYNWFVLFAPA